MEISEEGTFIIELFLETSERLRELNVFTRKREKELKGMLCFITLQYNVNVFKGINAMYLWDIFSNKMLVKIVFEIIFLGSVCAGVKHLSLQQRSC